VNKKLKIFTIRFFYVFLPLIALVALGASSYLWYKALTPEPERISLISESRVSPHAFSTDLERNLQAVLEKFGITENNIKSKKPETFKDEIGLIYIINIPEKVSLTLINLKITTMVEEMGGQVFLGKEGSGGRTLTLGLGAGKTRTDIVIFRKSRDLATIILPKVAVIIDDLGIKSVELAHRLCDIKQVLTIAVLPFQRYTSKVVDLARETKTPYILHMPMEPKSKDANPGKGALFAGDDRATVEKKLARAFKSVDKAEGLNNHMGSKATEDDRTMEYVMDYLHNNDNFFLDSKTSGKSVGYPVSQKNGVRGAVITGYIDVEDDKEYIEKRLEILIKHAEQNGYAIILGHDRPNTVSVLEKKLPEYEEKGIQFVRVSDLVY
jgi:uncharacterized protein